MKSDVTIFKNIRRVLERTKTIALKKMSGIESMRSFLFKFFPSVLERIIRIVRISNV